MHHKSELFYYYSIISNQSIIMQFSTGDYVKTTEEFNNSQCVTCTGRVIGVGDNYSIVRNYDSTCEELDFMSLDNSDLQLIRDLC